MPRTFKQYFRYFLVKAGLFDEGAFKLVLNRIYPSDIFLASFPKSGNTWLRFLIANAIKPNTEINFRNIDMIVPDVYSANATANSLTGQRFLKVHHPYFEHYPKCVYVVRDIRDVMVSYFHYMKKLGQFNGTIDEFAKRYSELHDFGTWKQHIKSAIHFSKKHPGRILIIKYEDLLNDPRSALKKILEFTKINFTGNIDEVIAKCSFAALKENENEHGSQFMDITRENFFRQGKMSTWKSELPEKSVFILEQENSEELNYFGYPLSSKKS